MAQVIDPAAFGVGADQGFGDFRQRFLQSNISGHTEPPGEIPRMKSQTSRRGVGIWFLEFGSCSLFLGNDWRRSLGGLEMSRPSRPGNRPGTSTWIETASH